MVVYRPRKNIFFQYFKSFTTFIINMSNNRQLFLKHLAQTSGFPLALEVESAQGIYLYGPDKKAYIDLISGISVSSIGHRHPNVLSAINQQLDKHLHVMVYGEFIQSSQVKLAQALASTLPENLCNAYLVNSGSEANEGALKLAKRYTGRYELISCTNAYHGSTHGALSVTGNESLKNTFRPLLPGVKHIDFNALNQLSEITSETAAVIIEPIQGEAGVIVPQREYLKALREKCNETGTLLIFDEVQTGFGRTGKFWAFEHFDVVPDILTCAKGMGGGMPIGAFISSTKIMSTLQNDPVLGHITTFGGHPVSAAASLATLETILKEGLHNSVNKKEALFLQLLKHEKIKSVRSFGLLIAVELSSPAFLQKVITKALKNGIVTDWFLFCDNSMRIAPPLIITEEEIKDVCERIIKSIEAA